MTFNTLTSTTGNITDLMAVLNLVINGWPSIQLHFALLELSETVLNLVINGWPSIRELLARNPGVYVAVLNLVINGWPSIPLPKG